jgi:hypothetical protein
MNRYGISGASAGAGFNLTLDGLAEIALTTAYLQAEVSAEGEGGGLRDD